MKIKSIVLVGIVLAVLTSSSRCINDREQITASKNYITRDYKVGDFDKLDMTVVADIEYVQSADGSSSLELYGPDNIVELVTVAVEDSTLTLKMKKKNIRKSNLKIKISSPELHYVKTSGVGNFNVKEKLVASSMVIKSEGVGNIKINDIACTDLSIRTEGVGDISVQGKTEKVSLVSQGVGNIEASNLESRSVMASSDGVGSISCHATESIDARVNGIGGISYKGNPTNKNLKKNGIGSISQK